MRVGRIAGRFIVTEVDALSDVMLMDRKARRRISVVDRSGGSAFDQLTRRRCRAGLMLAAWRRAIRSITAWTQPRNDVIARKLRSWRDAPIAMTAAICTSRPSGLTRMRWRRLRETFSPGDLQLQCVTRHGNDADDPGAAGAECGM